jgi:regulatory protein
MSGRITALKAQKRNSQRINVYLDGDFAFGLSRITAAWLQVGQELSDEKIASLQERDAREVAYQQALRLLDYRPRSSNEVRRRLEHKSIPAPIIDHVLERLQRSGLVDDARFAQAWVENRSGFHPRSARVLALELRQRGLERQAIDQALEGIDEAALALQAARKRARRFSTLEALEFRRRLSGFLVRRGFSYEVAGPVVEQVWQETINAKDEEVNT